jgi:hypothetical protein
VVMPLVSLGHWLSLCMTFGLSVWAHLREGKILSYVWHYKNWTLHCHLHKCTFQSAERVKLESRCITLWINRDFKCSSGLVASRKFHCIVHTCGEGMEDVWARGSSANEWIFRLKNCPTPRVRQQGNVELIRKAKHENLNCGQDSRYGGG